MQPSTQRLQQIATMYRNHNDQLRAVVYAGLRLATSPCSPRTMCCIIANMQQNDGASDLIGVAARIAVQLHGADARVERLAVCEHDAPGVRGLGF
jgi:hypothetical protein